tara:strand:- start:2080 stop:2346 length:267 start_codon:yes stop_codon:yes gene_type:complete
MHSYKDLVRENNYLRGCLNFESYVYAVCIGASGNQVKALGCIKFLNGIDHYRNRDKMFKNINCEKYWVLVEKSVYESFKKGKNSFLIK